MGSSEELEGDASSTHGTDHRSHLKRRFIFAKRQLHIENVIRMDLGLARDDTATHREVEHRALPADLTSGKREVKSHGNSEVFASLDGLGGLVQSKTGRQKNRTQR